jgi:hypothetical protein
MHGIQQRDAQIQYSGPLIIHRFQGTASVSVLYVKLTVTVRNRTGGYDHCYSISESAVERDVVYQGSAVFHYIAD